MYGLAEPLRIALAQLNTTVGDVDGNGTKILDFLQRARGEGAQLALFPELAVNGYPPEDLLLKTHFLTAGMDVLAEIAAEAVGIVALVGFAEPAEDVYNGLA